jgi:hypothetical protein
MERTRPACLQKNQKEVVREVEPGGRASGILLIEGIEVVLMGS